MRSVPRTPGAQAPSRAPAEESAVRRSGLGLCLWVSGCLTYPEPAAQRALYLDLRKVVELHDDSGWVHDASHARDSLEPVLHSLCQVSTADRGALDAWLSVRLGELGGSAEAVYRAHGRSLSAAAEPLALERTRLLLHTGMERAAECPFWLEPRSDFEGQQYDTGHFFLLAESTGFVSLVLQSWVPALGGGGRLLAGHGLGAQLSLAAGAEVAASGTLIPNDGQGLDATATMALPVLLRVTRLSRLLDVELAPVVRFASGHRAWPPGVRGSLGVGITGLRGAAFMSDTEVYLSYELHPALRGVAADHTLTLGTRIATDWSPR